MSSADSQIKKLRSRFFFAATILMIGFFAFAQASSQSTSSSDAGWDVRSVDTSNDILAVVATGYSSAWAFGSDGLALFTDSAGINWTEVDLGTTADLNDADFNNGTVVAVGDGGTVVMFTNNSWMDISLNTTVDLLGVSIPFSNKTDAMIYASGRQGQIWFWNGSWNLQGTGVSQDLYAIDFQNLTDGIAVGAEGTIVGTFDGGKTWDIRSLPQNFTTRNLYDVEYVSDKRIYAVGESGTFLRSAYSTDSRIGFRWVPWETNTNSTLRSLSASSLNKVWVVGDDGFISLTKDGGNSFKPQRTVINLTVSLNAIDMYDGAYGFIAGDSGTVLFTDREGIAIADIPSALIFGSFIEYAQFASPKLFEGLMATLNIVYYSIIVGFSIGISLAIMKTAHLYIYIPYSLPDEDGTYKTFKFNILKFIADRYTDVFRNTPLLVQFLFIHFGLVEIGIDLTFGGFIENRAYMSAIIALGLNSGAYQGEIIRSGIQAIPSGQMEAGRSLGLSYIQTMRYVVMPQAIRVVIPPLGNEFVNLILNSSLAFVIGYAELTRKGRLLIAITFKTFWTWGLVLMFYFFVTYSLSHLLRYIEKKTKIPGLGIGGEN